MKKFITAFFVILVQGALLFGNSKIYEEFWPEKFSARLLIRDWACQRDLMNAGCPSDYLNQKFTSVIDKNEVSLILEVGSRDAVDAICLSEYYKARIYSFECSPEGIEVCKYNIGSNPNITLVPLAIWNKNTSISFFPIVTGKQDSLIGLSSLLKIDSRGPIEDTQRQREITVQAVRLDDWLTKEKIDHVDLICIDVQGCTLQVLQGLGRKLANCKYIIAEVEHQGYYENQSLFPAVEAYLSENGFTLMTQCHHEGMYKDVADALFVRNDLIK